MSKGPRSAMRADVGPPTICAELFVSDYPFNAMVFSRFCTHYQIRTSYKETKDQYAEARSAAGELTSQRLLRQAIRKLFVSVNNRLERNALLTIMAILETAASNQAK
jgi:hypothetical protein